MRKYTGKYPLSIRTVAGITSGKVRITLNNGLRTYVCASDNFGVMPRPGQPVTAFLCRDGNNVIQRFNVA